MPPQTEKDTEAINQAEEDTLHSAGVDVAGLSHTTTASVQKPTAKAKDSKAESVVDIDDGVPKTDDPDLAKTGIKFVDEETATKEAKAEAPEQTVPVNKEDLSALAEAKMKASDLEEEFRSELTSSEKTSAGSGDFGKTSTMTNLLQKIREKLGIKKNKVKSELENLKKMKDGISGDIADIKELEESEKKIEAEIEKVGSIKEEIDSIEKEVSEELKD